MKSIFFALPKNRYMIFAAVILFLIPAFNIIAQTTVNFNLLTTDTDQSNPFNHTENSVTWTLTVSSSNSTANIHTWGDGTVNFQTGPNGTLGSAKGSISRQDGADFNFKGIKLEATIQDQYIRVYGKNNGSTVYGPTAVDLVTGNLIQTFSPANWDGVDEIELIVYAATSGTGGYDNDMYLFIDDFQYTMNVVPSISNLNGDSGTFTEGDTPLTLDSGTGASVTDSDATGYNGGNVTVSITGATASEDISISTAGSVSLSAGMTAGSTVSVSGISIGTIAAGNTGQDGSNLIVSLNSNATDARIGALIQSITYTNDSQNPSGSRTVNFTVADGAGGTSTTSSITVTLSGVNDDPTLTGKPTDITVTEDVASNVDLSAVTFGDVDAGATSITFTIAAGAGTLSASSGGGVTIGGSGTATLTFSGTAANIDTYLNTASNIKYTSVSNANGSDVTTLTLSANDGGATGTGGGGNVSFGTVNVDITSVNDDPAIASLPTDITVTEETASNVDLSAATFSDVDAGSSSITLAIAAGAGTLSATSGGSVTIGGSGTGTMTLTGTVSNIDTYLNTASNIKYTGASNASGDNATTLTVTANDGGATGTGGGGNVTLGTVNVDITGINDDPTITGLPTDITVVEDVASNVDLSAATFADVDAGANSITLTIAAGAGTLSVAASAGLTFSGNATGTITITGTASNIDSYLNTSSNILYTSAANANGNDATTLTLTANDGGFTGTGGGNDVSLGTVNVDITAVNDPPIVSNVFGDNSSQVIAGSGAQNITDLDDATVANNDSPDYNAGFLTIAQISGTTNGNFGVDGTTVTSGGDATITAGETIAVSGTSIGTVHATDDGQGGNNLQIDFNSANSTDARIQSLIRSLTYSAASGLGARVFTLTLNDKDGTANGGDEDASGNFTITVTPNPPILGNIDGDNATIPVGGAKGNIDVGGNATVTDADSPNFNGGNLTITQNTGTANGNFSVTGSGASGVASGTSLGTADQTITGSEIIYVDGVAIASVSASSDGQSGDDLVLNLGSNATPARTQQAIRALQYAAPSGLGNRTFTISVQDANVGGATGTANFTITITPPEIDLKQGTTAIADGGSFNYGNKALNSDNDITFTIHNTATGVLSITTPITLAGADAGQFSIQQQPGVTVAANDSTTFIVRFKPTSAGAKTASIAITNNDTDENPYNITLNGSGNNPPTGGDDQITINANSTYTFSVSDFTYGDPDSDPFAGINLQSLETDGTLKYNNVDAAAFTDYPDVTKLTFTPNPGASGLPYATFTYKVRDILGGQSAATYTMTINVNAVPEAPTIVTNLGSTINEGESITLSEEVLSATDADGPVYSIVYHITGLPLHGELKLNNSPFDTTSAVSFTQNDLSNGKISYTHSGDESISDSFTFYLSDTDGNNTSEYGFEITIIGVNDPPVISDIPEILMDEDETYSINITSWLEYVSDPDTPDSLLSFNLTSGANITIVEVENNSFNVVPNANYFGTTSVTLTVNDGEFQISKIISVVIQPVNDLPVISVIPDSISLEYEGSTAFQVIGNDTETPDSLLVFSLSASDGITTEYNYETSTISVSANPGFSGESLLAISLSDTDGGLTTIDVHVSVGNDPTGIERLEGIPEDYSLFQNYPNPFNPSTSIRFGVPEESEIKLFVYDILGREVEVLFDGVKAPGFYQYNWNAVNYASGIYFYILTTSSQNSEYREVKKMLLIK